MVVVGGGRTTDLTVVFFGVESFAVTVVVVVFTEFLVVVFRCFEGSIVSFVLLGPVFVVSFVVRVIVASIFTVSSFIIVVVVFVLQFGIFVVVVMPC